MSLHVDIKHRLADFELSFNATLPSEGITVVFGPSGCGKTTLLRCLAGLTSAKNSSITFKGTTWQSDKVFVKSQRRKVAMVFQHDNLLPHLNVTQNINYAIKRRKQAGLSFNELVVMFDLSGLLIRQADELSGGERQRVSMARALASAPELLLMDEPMSALDDDRKMELLSYLKTIKKHTPIIYVTHSRQEMMRLADHVVLMDKGRIKSSGEFWDLIQKEKQLLNQKNQLWSVLPGVVKRHDQAFGLSVVAAAGGEIWVNQDDLPVGDSVRLLFNGSDLSISLTAPENSSILNVLPVVVGGIKNINSALSQICLNLSNQNQGEQLQALITRKSAVSLALMDGQSVWVQIKSVAVLI